MTGHWFAKTYEIIRASPIPGMIKILHGQAGKSYAIDGYAGSQHPQVPLLPALYAGAGSCLLGAPLGPPFIRTQGRPPGFRERLGKPFVGILSGWRGLNLCPSPSWDISFQMSDDLL